MNELITSDKKTFYIIHGYCDSSLAHWFKWIKKELQQNNIIVHILRMPGSRKPQKEEWVEFLNKNIIINNNTYIIGHSLGCIASLLFLNRQNIKIGGIILVAGFLSKLKEIPDIDNFCDEKIDAENLINNIEKRVVIGSPEDRIVPFHLTQCLATALDVPVISLKDAGHFMGVDGYTEFPILLKEAKKMVIGSSEIVA